MKTESILATIPGFSIEKSTWGNKLIHSTGRNVYNIGNVEEWFDEYNTTNNTNFSITEREYPATPYPHDNYPYDYWNLWGTENEDTTIRIPACDSENPNIECLDT